MTEHSIGVNRNLVLALIDATTASSDLAQLQAQVITLRERVLELAVDAAREQGADEDMAILRRDVLLAELEQISTARTIERARYYLKRLRNSMLEIRTGKINDINLARWKEYDDIITDSLWYEPRRDTSGAHLGWYWGNFIPQIPYQALLRYTRRGDWVFDAFAGSGTTLIECRRLGRNGLGVELNPAVASKARERVELEANPSTVTSAVLVGDSRNVDLRATLAEYGVEQFQLAILHPPYHDIISFSDADADLSNAPTIDAFLAMFAAVVANLTPLLAAERYLVLVIGDKYVRGEWVPLGFRCMETVLQHGYTLKSIVVKNFDATRGKRTQKELWRYRALVGGFYVFKHEYVMIFRKRR